MKTEATYKITIPVPVTVRDMRDLGDGGIPDGAVLINCHAYLHTSGLQLTFEWESPETEEKTDGADEDPT